MKTIIFTMIDLNNLFAFSFSKSIIKLFINDIQHLRIGDHIDTSNFTFNYGLCKI